MTTPTLEPPFRFVDCDIPHVQDANNTLVDLRELVAIANRATSPITDDALAELTRLAKAATPGKWWADSEDCGYAVFSPDGKVLVDTHNSDAAEIHEEPDEYGVRAWDEVGKRNAAYIAAAHPQAVLGLIEEVKAGREALEEYGHHGDDCARWALDGTACSCGFDAARAHLATPAGPREGGEEGR